MSFISFEFIFFFPLVVVLFFLSPQKYRWAVLLAASCVFYMAFIPKYILVLFFTIIIDYFAGILIQQSAPGRKKKALLTLSILANLGVLALFKYYNFFLDNFRLTDTFPVLKMVLPIGLSFHTFQAMAYTIEVYRGRQSAERHFGIYALYILFFPQLVAGPIERPQNVLPQFHEKKTFEYNNAVGGLRLILWGFFKKMVIADRLAVITDQVYSAPANYSSCILIVATIFFAFQIYCDFSGYSDIAVGTARMMGFRLMKNFNFPYQSRNLQEFWSRWHISLSTWFRDYVYFPLGGKRVILSRWCFNIMLVFLLSGFWHGANWTFLIWGLLNGIYIILGKITSPYRDRLAHFIKLDRIFFYKWLQVFVTFVLITISWIFFRAKNVTDALTILYRQKSLVPDLFNTISNIRNQGTIEGLAKRDVLASALLIAGLCVSELIIAKNTFNRFYLPQKKWLRWLVYYAIIILIVSMGIYKKTDFIYFQF